MATETKGVEAVKQWRQRVQAERDGTRYKLRLMAALRSMQCIAGVSVMSDAACHTCPRCLAAAAALDTAEQ